MMQIMMALMFICCALVCTDCSCSAPKGSIRIDGSSTVFPITEAVAEEFQKVHKTRIVIGVSGTGGGFAKLCSGLSSVIGASRPIKISEKEHCAQHNIDYIEIPVAYDGIVIAVHPHNTWVDKLTVSELRRMWEPAAQGTIKTWNHIRPDWPNEELHLFSPGVDSGTYDYFTQAIVGKQHASRGDITSSEDDNVLVQGIATDVYALGYFGYAYYIENQDKLKAVPIVNDAESAGAVMPSQNTIRNGSYKPLSRPILLYVSHAHAKQEQVDKFMNYYLHGGLSFIEEVHYVPLSMQAYNLVRKRFAQRKTGSIFENETETKGKTVEQILNQG